MLSPASRPKKRDDVHSVFGFLMHPGHMLPFQATVTQCNSDMEAALSLVQQDLCAELSDIVAQPASRREAIMLAFQDFRQEFDDHNDRRERLIKVCCSVARLWLWLTSRKLSRDATNLSKKVIFLLQRIATEETDEDEAVAAAVQQSRQKFAEIIPVFSQMRAELAPGTFWRYQKTIAAALQEYIEARAFAHYLEHRTLLTFAQVQRDLVLQEEGASVRCLRGGAGRGGAPRFSLSSACAAR